MPFCAFQTPGYYQGRLIDVPAVSPKCVYMLSYAAGQGSVGSNPVVARVRGDDHELKLGPYMKNRNNDLCAIKATNQKTNTTASWLKEAPPVR